VGFLGWVFLGECTQKNPPGFWVRTQVSEPWHSLIILVFSSERHGKIPVNYCKWGCIA